MTTDQSPPVAALPEEPPAVKDWRQSLNTSQTANSYAYRREIADHIDALRAAASGLDAQVEALSIERDGWEAKCLLAEQRADGLAEENLRLSKMLTECSCAAGVDPCCCPCLKTWKEAAEAAEQSAQAAVARAAELERDAARLDFVLAEGAFIDKSKTDTGAIVYQLLNQDEDENFHTISGDGKFFATTSAAIDAALNPPAPV